MAVVAGVGVTVGVEVMLLGGRGGGLLAEAGVEVDPDQDRQDQAAENQAQDQRQARGLKVGLEAEQGREASRGVDPGGVAGLGVALERGANQALVQAVGADLEARVDQDLLQGRDQALQERDQVLQERDQEQTPRVAQIIEELALFKFDIPGSEPCNIMCNVTFEDIKTLLILTSHFQSRMQ